jgi:sigma-E factor negative regulatory protein RseC
MSDAMVEEVGCVTGSYAGGVWVEVERQAVCDGCNARKGCGSAQLARLSRMPPVRLAVDTSLSLNIGDRVRLGLRAADLTRASLLAYGVPLLFALAAAAGLELWLASDAWSGLGFMAGLAVGALWLRRHHHRRASRYQPRLLDILSRAEPFGAQAV